MKQIPAVALLLAGSAEAQQRADSVQKTFVVRRNLVWAAGVVAGSAAMSVFDKRIAAWTRRSGVQGDSARRDRFDSSARVPFVAQGRERDFGLERGGNSDGRVSTFE